MFVDYDEESEASSSISYCKNKIISIYSSCIAVFNYKIYSNVSYHSYIIAQIYWSAQPCIKNRLTISNSNHIWALYGKEE
jgi:hypothetical protein